MQVSPHFQLTRQHNSLNHRRFAESLHQRPQNTVINININTNIYINGRLAPDRKEQIGATLNRP